MKLVNGKDFAVICGVTPKSVSKWKKAGRLVTQGELIDVDASIAMLERYRRGGVTPITLEGNQGNQEGNREASKGNRPSEIEAKRPVIDLELRPGESAEAAADRMISEIDVDGTSFDEARRIKEVYLAMLNRLEYEQKSGSLVDLMTAGDVLFSEFRAQRDSWLNWPARIGPMVAAELKVDADKVVEILTEYVHKHITQLGEPQAEFTEPSL